MEVGFVGNGLSSSGEVHEEANSRKRKKQYHRHSAQQIQQLESFFRECPHPDENQRRQLGRELGLDPKQIKFWFQNKRSQTKAQNERADNNALRAENERIHCENIAIREALKNVICPACGGLPFSEEDRLHNNLQNLQMENAKLKEEHEKANNFLVTVMGKPFSENLASGFGSSVDLVTSDDFTCQGMGGLPLDPLEFAASKACNNNVASTYSFNNNNNNNNNKNNGIMKEMEKSLILKTASNAMDELVKLLQVNEPLWIKSPSDGRYVLHRDSYDKLFPKPNHFRSSSTRTESSKDSGVVTMDAVQLIDMFLDANKWVDIFPTIVVKAQTLGVLDNIGEQLGGSLYLMQGQMHIVSPLVAPREFFFLRYCQQMNDGIWVIVDVSYDCLRESKDVPPSLSWRLPSGCMIQDLSDGKSQVTWVEHVQVDDKSLTHRLYRDLVCGCQAYGAKRWIVILQRICERRAYSLGSRTTPNHALEEVIDLPEGRRSIMSLSHRMIKNFCSMLSMSNKLDFPHLSELKNSGIRVSVRKSDEPGQPHGVVVSAATSLWLPCSIENLFSFFRDEKTRAKWDVLSNGNPVNEIAHISCGSNPGNCISIIQPFVPKESSMLILQESFMDPLGALVVYAPIDLPAITSAISGNDTTSIPILPSGFVISGDGRAAATASTTSTGSSMTGNDGSLVTVAFQILVCSNMSSNKPMDMELVATVNTLISSTVQKIKEALDCTDLD